MYIPSNKAIFKNPSIQAQFNEDGYVVIDFISEELAQSLTSYFYELHKTPPKGFYAEAYNPNQDTKNHLFSLSDKILETALTANFCNFKKLGCTYLCKAPGEEGKVNVHQDWSVVDEPSYYSVTVWIPLSDVGENNGALRVLPGSHKFFNAYRSNNIPVSYKGNEQLLWDNMITVPMKAGQAFVLNHAVIHASAANTTPKERLVLAYGMVPADAHLVFYHKEKNDPLAPVEKYSMPDDFFQRYYNVGERPHFGNLVEQFPYSVPALPTAKIIELIEREYTPRNLPVHS